MSQGTADYSVYLRHALSGNVAIAEKQRTAEEMQNARWIVMRRHKERRRNTGAEWKGRSIFFLKERVKRALWRVFDKCFEAAPVWGHGSCHTLNSSGRLKPEIP